MSPFWIFSTKPFNLRNSRATNSIFRIACPFIVISMNGRCSLLIVCSASPAKNVSSGEALLLYRSACTSVAFFHELSNTSEIGISKSSPIFGASSGSEAVLTLFSSLLSLSCRAFHWPDVSPALLLAGTENRLPIVGDERADELVTLSPLISDQAGFGHVELVTSFGHIRLQVNAKLDG